MSSGNDELFVVLTEQAHIPPEVQHILRVDPLSIPQQMAELPELLAQWGSAAVQYESLALQSKDFASRCWAEAYKAARETGTKVTEKQAEAIADTDERYLGYRNESNQYSRLGKLAREIHHALTRKLDVLVNLSADRRAEWKAT